MGSGYKSQVESLYAAQFVLSYHFRHFVDTTKHFLDTTLAVVTRLLFAKLLKFLTDLYLKSVCRRVLSTEAIQC